MSFNFLLNLFKSEIEVFSSEPGEVEKFYEVQQLTFNHNFGFSFISIAGTFEDTSISNFYITDDHFSFTSFLDDSCSKTNEQFCIVKSMNFWGKS